MRTDEVADLDDAGGLFGDAPPKDDLEAVGPDLAVIAAETAVRLQDQVRHGVAFAGRPHLRQFLDLADQNTLIDHCLDFLL